MYTKIEIDFEVFKEITQRRNAEEVTPNDVIRQALGLGKRDRIEVYSKEDPIPWIAKGVHFPHGTEFRAQYKGNLYRARAENGALICDGKTYHSPSPAACDITKHSVNGWIFWECKRPGETDWIKIKELKK